MAFEFDPEKDSLNRLKHGIGLGDFTGFDEYPTIVPDTRREYGEDRFRAFGRIDTVPHCLVFTYRGENLRLISFRRAHQEELDSHDA